MKRLWHCAAMKALGGFFAVIVILVSLTAHAQPLASEQVPGSVQEGFKAKFPNVKSAEWKLKTDKNYEAEFTLKGTEIAAKFDAAGKWLETESAISRSKVPKPVRATAANQFKHYKVVETQSVQRWNDDGLVFELHLDNGQQIVKIQCSADGSIVNQSQKPKPQKH